MCVDCRPIYLEYYPSFTNFIISNRVLYINVVEWRTFDSREVPDLVITLVLCTFIFSAVTGHIEERLR